MISNESVQRLIACDRDTLIALMAAAYAHGNAASPNWDVYLDMDIRALLESARVANRMPTYAPYRRVSAAASAVPKEKR